ncbi:MAG: hypothetical protein D6731_16425 [Planctomycetota bacterium]|nr:MAG: hypothetical protein D6731_16425 [Planctomycetota bacterium]
MPAALRVQSGYLRQRVLLLPSDGSRFLIGRSLEANLILYGPDVAERQAYLVADGKGHRLVPLSTKAPVRVGERVLTRAVPLREGDTIRIGRHVLRYTRQGARAAIGSDERGVPCSSCGEPLGSRPETRPSLKALRLGDEVVCPRCVDLRLHADRGLDTYRILRKVGANDEEVTYLAVDEERDERVSVRIMKADRQARPRAFRRFLVRALVGLVLDHPNYLPVEAIRAHGGITYVVLQYLEHSTKLERLAREQSPIPGTSAIYVTNQLAEVLRFARLKRIVVAKRKKSGVLVDRAFWVKVLAYDVTRELEEQVARTQAFRDLAARSGFDPDVLATTDLEPPSPEERRLSSLASEYAEVYSVGRILYQLVTGQPFRTGTLGAISEALAAVEAGRPPPEGPLEKCTPHMIRLVERVLLPRGPHRIRTLEGFARASKRTFGLLAEA